MAIGALAGVGLLGLLFWIGVITGAVWPVKWFATQAGPSAPSGDPDALEIVRRRYARGEISREEYDLAGKA